MATDELFGSSAADSREPPSGTVTIDLVEDPYSPGIRASVGVEDEATGTSAEIVDVSPGEAERWLRDRYPNWAHQLDLLNEALQPDPHSGPVEDTPWLRHVASEPAPAMPSVRAAESQTPAPVAGPPAAARATETPARDTRMPVGPDAWERCREPRSADQRRLAEGGYNVRRDLAGSGAGAESPSSRERVEELPPDQRRAVEDAFRREWVRETLAAMDQLRLSGDGAVETGWQAQARERREFAEHTLEMAEALGSSPLAGIGSALAHTFSDDPAVHLQWARTFASLEDFASGGRSRSTRVARGRSRSGSRHERRRHRGLGSPGVKPLRARVRERYGLTERSERVLLRGAEIYKEQMARNAGTTSAAEASRRAHAATQRRLGREFPNEFLVFEPGTGVTGGRSAGMSRGDIRLVAEDGIVLEFKRTAWVRPDGTLVIKAWEGDVPGQTKQVESLEIMAREEGLSVFVLDQHGAVYGFAVTTGRWEPVN
jgi:hypothetical protein